MESEWKTIINECSADRWGAKDGRRVLAAISPGYSVYADALTSILNDKLFIWILLSQSRWHAFDVGNQMRNVSDYIMLWKCDLFILRCGSPDIALRAGDFPRKLFVGVHNMWSVLGRKRWHIVAHACKHLSMHLWRLSSRVCASIQISLSTFLQAIWGMVGSRWVFSSSERL